MSLIDTWLEKLDADGRSPHTVKGYERALALFSRWHTQTYGDAAFDPAKVLPKDFKEWVSRQQSVERAKPATINQRVAAVRKFFAWLHESGQLAKNPAAEVRFLDTDKAEFKGLDEKHYKQLSRAVYLDENLRDIAIFEAMIGAGLRVSEVLDLQVGDLVIRERDTRDNFSYIIVREGKGSKRRTVPMTKTVKSAFANYLQSYADDTSPQAKLWTGQRGALSSPSGIHKMLAHYARAAKLPEDVPVHAHALRHTFAYLFLKKHPGDIRTLADLLGHNDLKTTMRYTASTEADKAAKMADLD
ncbi:MAG: tyrosine-type recombinase/integrase [Anaerolineales bacterium]|jgi:site-specific recombinase XerD|nr:tyrosine-type recombinase/integrase [Anaerolineales bacterium]